MSKESAIIVKGDSSDTAKKAARACGIKPTYGAIEAALTGGQNA